MTEPFNFPDGRMANNAEDLLELCEQYPDEATGFLVRQDLEKWLAYIGSYDVAECAANARQIDTGDRQKLEDFLNRCHSLSEPKPVPAAAVEPNIKDNMTPPESGEPIMDVPPKWTESASLKTGAIPPKPPEAAPDNLPAEATPTPTPESKSEEAVTESEPEANQANSSNNSQEKPSFFQVVAKFIVKILYRDKA